MIHFTCKVEPPIDVATLRPRLEAAVSAHAPTKPDFLTIAGLEKLFHEHSIRTYNGRHGAAEVKNISHAFKILVTLYGDVAPDDLTTLQLRAARQYWIERGIMRTTIAARMERLRRCWKWAKGNQLVGRDLPAIEAVRFGHAPEPERIKPVDLDVFEMTLPYLSPTVGIMLKVQLYAGMRPGEVCDMRGSEIDISKQPWVYRPALHKSKWKGKDRTIFIGPRAQILLQKYLKPSYLFTTRTGGRWTSQLLYQAVYYACNKFDLPRWHPNQLRHTAATALREQFGLDAAQAVLGHTRVETTQIYAERMSGIAIEAMRKLG
jgi:integrase